MIEHHNKHEFIHGHRLRPLEALRGLKHDTGISTLTEQGVDVDELIDANRQEIERMRSRTPPTSTGLDSSTPTGPRSTT